jgi:hypothetical protein
MAGLLSVATTAVSSAKVAVVDSGEVGRSAVYRQQCPWGTPTFTGENSVYSFSTLTRK